jgi:hypothetical protein
MDGAFLASWKVIDPPVSLVNALPSNFEAKTDSGLFEYGAALKSLPQPTADDLSSAGPVGER